MKDKGFAYVFDNEVLRELYVWPFRVNNCLTQNWALQLLYYIQQPLPLKQLHSEKMHLEKNRDTILISYGSSSCIQWCGFLWQSCLEHFCLQQRQQQIRVFLCQNPPIKQTVSFLSLFTAFKPLTVLQEFRLLC